MALTSPSPSPCLPLAASCTDLASVTDAPTSALEAPEPSTEVKLTHEQEYRSAQEFLCLRVADPRFNTACGIMPSQRYLEENWCLMLPRVCEYQMHHSSCPRNKNCRRRLHIVYDDRVHCSPSTLCSCTGSMTEDQMEVFNYITKVATHPITSDLYAIIAWNSAAHLTHVLAASVCEKAVWLENAYAHSTALKGPVEGNLVRDIEVYVENQSKCDNFLNTCVHMLEYINGRKVIVTSEGYIISRHPENEDKNAPSVLIKIMPHKAVRKSWNPFPAAFVYIDNAMRVNYDTPCVRAFATGHSFTSMGQGKSFRQFIVVGANTDFAQLTRAEHDWIDFRKMSGKIRMQKFLEQQKKLNQFQRETTDKINETILETTAKREEKEKQEEEEFNKPNEPIEMTDAEFKARDHFKKLKEMKTLEGLLQMAAVSE